LILVDSSIWIELINGAAGADRDAYLRFVTCGPILQEVLQGLRPSRANREFQEAMLALPRVGDPVSTDLYLEAARIYAHGRRKGLTIRASADCLIPAIAIAHGVPVWHNDRDFDEIAKYTALEIVSPRPESS
jgi:predicted nucleic acid-binding protein